MNNHPSTRILMIACILLLCSNGIPAMAADASTAPATPPGLQVSQQGSQLHYTWNANSEPDLYDYFISLTTTYPNGKYSLAFASTSSNECTINCVYGNTYEFKVRARNTSYLLSPYSTPVVITPVDPTITTSSSTASTSPAAGTDTSTASSTSSTSAATDTTSESNNTTASTASSEANTALSSTNDTADTASSPATDNPATAGSTTATNTDSADSSTQPATTTPSSTNTDIVGTTATETPAEPVPTPTPLPPAAPTGVQVSAVGNSLVTLCWKANTETDLKGYNISYKPASGEWKTLFTANTTYTIESLNNNVLYSFKAAAVNQDDLSSPDSTEVTATPSTDVSAQVALLGAPFTKGTYARNVWDMQSLDGKIYLGHGDAASDAGPIPILYLDSDSGQFVQQYTAAEEQVDVYKILDGRLTAPGMDATESWNYGNFYTLDGGNWDKHRTIPIATHVYDIASYNGKIYAAVESQSHDASLPPDIALTASSDGGKTWTSQMPKSSSLPFGSGSCIGRTLFEFNGKLYCIGTLTPGYVTTNNNNVLVTDGTTATIQKMANLLPGGKQYYSHRILRPTTIGGSLLYLGVINCNGCEWDPDGLFKASDLNRASKVSLPESQALPTDILARGTTAYVLAYIPQANNKFANIVYKSDDLNTWTELFRFTSDAFARSFEEMNGDFYFGLGCNTSTKPASTGNILKVPQSVYKASLAS